MENNTADCAFFKDSQYRRVQMFSANYAVMILNCILCFTATLQNVPVIMAIIRTPSLHNPSNVLLCSLAITDLAVGVVVHPIFVAFKARLLQGDFVCPLLFAKEGLVIYTAIVSMLTLLAISLERLIALYVHLRYKELVTIPRVIAIAIATWFLWGLIVCAWPLGLIDIYTLSLVGIIIIVVVGVALTVACAIIFRILRRHQAVIMDQSKLQAAKTFSRSRKSAAVILQVVVLFFVFYAPCTYATIRFNLTKDFDIRQNILWEITETVALINASVNPLLYYWKMGSIRRAVKNLYCVSQEELFQRTTEFSM